MDVCVCVWGGGGAGVGDIIFLLNLVIFHILDLYITVCVCVRERERERGGGRERGERIKLDNFSPVLLCTVCNKICFNRMVYLTRARSITSAKQRFILFVDVM